MFFVVPYRPHQKNTSTQVLICVFMWYFSAISLSNCVSAEKSNITSLPNNIWGITHVHNTKKCCTNYAPKCNMQGYGFVQFLTYEQQPLISVATMIFWWKLWLPWYIFVDPQAWVFLNPKYFLLIFFLPSTPALLCFFLYVTFFLSLHQSLWLSFSLSTFRFEFFPHLTKCQSVPPPSDRPACSQNKLWIPSVGPNLTHDSCSSLSSRVFIHCSFFHNPCPYFPPSICLWSNSSPLFCAPVFCCEPRGTCSHM